MNAPNKVLEIKAWITAGIAFMTALWGWLGWAIGIFMICIVLDYVTGSWAAKAHGEWSSAVAREGLWHKLGEIVALLVASLCDIAIKVVMNTAAAPLVGDVKYRNWLTLIVAFWYILTEVGSILENAAKLGAPIPAWLTKGAARLKKKVDEEAAAAPEPVENRVENESAE